MIKEIISSFSTRLSSSCFFSPKSYMRLISRSLYTPSAENFSCHQIIKLQPGLVHIKAGLSPVEQVKLAQYVLERGEDPGKGFWRTNEKGEKILNSTEYRGRIFDSLSAFPPIATDLLQRSLKQASEMDTTLKPITATHCIFLYYKSLVESPPSGFIPWHQDNGENDGEGDAPVVSFTIGDSCDFLINQSKPKLTPNSPASHPQNLAHRVRFESGDILVFGGPSRYIWHAIYKMHLNTAPHFLPFRDARLNFTFRYTPKIIGEEERFATKNAKDLPKDNQFYKLSKMN